MLKVISFANQIYLQYLLLIYLIKAREKREKQMKKRKDIVNEVADTERRYVAQLTTAVNVKFISVGGVSRVVKLNLGLVGNHKEA